VTKPQFQIHYHIKSDFNAALLEKIERLIKGGINGVVLNPVNSKITIEQGRQIAQFCGDTAELIITDDYDFAKQINAKILFLSNLDESITDLAVEYPNMHIWGRAETLTDCKNWELLGANYIDFNPPQTGLEEDKSPFILGAELYQAVIPKKVEYGWMILSLNTPVFASNIMSLSDLTELIDNTQIAGVIINDDFEAKLDLVNSIERIRELVN
jgi:hypothetical protein